MPLPAALQSRLAKRGLLKREDSYKNEKENKDVNPQSNGKCPNTVNPFHECSDYCRKRWGTAAKTNTNEAHYQRMPLPPGWFLVPDHTSGASYYWNTMTNQVTWLHPLNPKADITNPVSSDGKSFDVMPNHAIPSPLTSTGSDKDQILNIGKHPSLVKGSQKKIQAAVKRKQHEQDVKARKKRTDDLDPLDPAAYSDVPRGTWSTGLVDKGEAKTGVDTTANGPLFQQRPYPSPGEVLRRNAAIKS